MAHYHLGLLWQLQDDHEQARQAFGQPLHVVHDGIAVNAENAGNVFVGLRIQGEAIGGHAAGDQLLHRLFGVVAQVLRVALIDIGGFAIGHEQDKFLLLRLAQQEIAGVAQFFSYGTNDLSQMTFGYSRDDAERGFLLQYVEQEVLPDNPFQVLDENGVGKLVEMGAKLGRKTRSELEVGICGEHGGEPSSIDFCHRAGLNYVSCSPFRVPIARLAAAHAALMHRPQA